MRMKHWSYIGVGLIALNAFVLKVALAAEFSQGFPYKTPSGIFRLPFTGFWKATPQPEILAPVTLRLFADKKLTSLWIRNSAGLLILDHPMQGAVSISLDGRKISVLQPRSLRKDFQAIWRQARWITEFLN